MIKITDVTGKEKYINCDLIERVETIPDTLISLLNGHSVIVKEDVDTIIEKIKQFKIECCSKTQTLNIIISNQENHDE